MLSSLANFVQLVKSVLFAAIYSPKASDRMVELMEKFINELGPAVASPIAEMIQNMERATDAHAEPDLPEVEQPDPEIQDQIQRDPELEREERLIRANQEIKQLKQKLSDTTEDLEEARKRVYSLEEEIAESRLQMGRSSMRFTDDEELSELRAQAMKDRDYIAQLESDLMEARDSVDRYESQLERLKADAETKLQLRDELQMVRAERDELAGKAKANENLRKKIQTMQEKEKASQALQEDYASLKEQIDELETLREQASALRKANEENMVTIANGEQEIFDQKTSKKRLEHDLKLCTGRLEQAKEMANRYQEANQELENKLRELEDRATGAEALGSLEEQLAKEDDDGKSMMRRSFFGVETADVILLQQKISLLESRCKRIEEKYLDVYQENLGLQAALQDEQELKEA